MSESVLFLDSSVPLPAEAGGKASGLQTIIRAGLPSPRTWVILPDSAPSSVEALTGRLREERISLLAVRSSAREEDGHAASFAGIHDSLLGVKPEDLAGSVPDVSGSTDSLRARAYRESLGLGPPQGPSAVLVQELVPARVAGVAFSTGPGVAIEAVEGLGETAVDGRAVPESLFLSRRGGIWQLDRWTQRIQTQASVVDRDARQRVVRRAGSPEEPLLSFSVASEIADAVRRLEQAMENPVDVEWAVSDERPVYLQVRVQTRRLEPVLAPGEVWTRANVRDTYPEIPSAIGRSILRLALDPGVRDHLRSCGAPVDPSASLLTTVFGRPVLNERIYLPGDLLGIPRSSVQVDFGGADEADDRVGSADLGRLVGHPVVLVRSTITALRAARRVRRWLTTTTSAGAELDQVEIETASPAQLLAIIRQTSARVGRGMVGHALALAAGVSNAQYMALLLIRDHDSPRALLARLVGGEEGTTSTHQLDALASLARGFSRDTGSEPFTAEVRTEHKDRAFWESQLSPPLWAGSEAWLDRFGHRGPFESDLASPRYSEDLRLFAQTLFPIVRAVRHGHPVPRPEERKEKARMAWREVEARWGPRTARRLRQRVGTLGALLRLREELRSETVRSTYPLRQMVVALGQSLAETGRLEDPSEVWHLSLEDLGTALREPGFPLDIAVAREQSRRAAWRRMEVPNRFTSEDVEGFSYPASPPDLESAFTTLRGNGVSPGIVEGRVAVLRSPAEARGLGVGSVVVAPATDPGWTPLFAQAIAIVVELGGALSHAGIVAREFGIPCVANIPGVTRRLRSGDLVRVDGSSGTVTLLSRASWLGPWAKD